MKLNTNFRYVGLVGAVNGIPKFYGFDCSGWVVCDMPLINRLSSVVVLKLLSRTLL